MIDRNLLAAIRSTINQGGLMQPSIHPLVTEARGEKIYAPGGK